jgi:hypothetical protein
LNLQICLSLVLLGYIPCFRNRLFLSWKLAYHCHCIAACTEDGLAEYKRCRIRSLKLVDLRRLYKNK